MVNEAQTPWPLPASAVYLCQAGAEISGTRTGIVVHLADSLILFNPFRSGPRDILFPAEQCGPPTPRHGAAIPLGPHGTGQIVSHVTARVLIPRGIHPFLQVNTPAKCKVSGHSSTRGQYKVETWVQPILKTTSCPLHEAVIAFISLGLRCKVGARVPLNGNGWTPQNVTRFIQSFGTAAGTARVETDLGEGYIKALGNSEGPHVLACELIGSMLADWLGLATLDFALIEVTPDDDIPFLRGGSATAGPAFISRAEATGFPWGGTADELQHVHNRNDINGLVVLDTWILNCDRYAPHKRRVNRDNVFFVQYPGSKREVLLKAMDFTHAFTCGREINRRIGFIDNVQDDQVYGLFQEFEGFIDREEIRRFAARLRQFSREVANAFIALIPEAWEVDNNVKGLWAAMITQRAQFVAETIEMKLCPQQQFNEGGTE